MAQVRLDYLFGRGEPLRLAPEVMLRLLDLPMVDKVGVEGHVVLVECFILCYSFLRISGIIHNRFARGFALFTCLNASEVLE